MISKTRFRIRDDILLIFSLTLLLIVPSTNYASSDVGFVIRKNNFTITVRIGLDDLDLNSSSEGIEITRADHLFFDCLEWVDSQKDGLDKRNRDITVFWFIKDKSFGIQIDDSYEGDFKYKYAQGFNTLSHEIERLLNLTPVKKKANNYVSLYVVSSKPYIDNIFEISDIFFGSIPGYMYSKDENKYLLLMWSWDASSALSKKLHLDGARVQQIKLTRQRAFKLLGQLE